MPVDDWFMNLTDDLERIVDHACTVHGVDMRASQAEQRWEQLAETRARNTILEYESQLRLTLEHDMLHLPFRVRPFWSKGSEVAAVAILRQVHQHLQFRNASMVQIQ